MVRQTPVRRTPFTIDNYSFPTGGPDDLLQLDFVRDRAQGLNAPARSLAIRNNGAGTIYFVVSEDGEHWGGISSLPAGNLEAYSTEDGIVVRLMTVWASAAGTRVTIRAAPGYDKSHRAEADYTEG